MRYTKTLGVKMEPMPTDVLADFNAFKEGETPTLRLMGWLMTNDYDKYIALAKASAKSEPENLYMAFVEEQAASIAEEEPPVSNA